MPFLKIHLSGEIESEKLSHLAREVRESMVKTLRIDTAHGHVAIYTAPIAHRSVHESRSPNFVFTEILMFSGRTDEMKEELFKSITQVIEKHIEVDKVDILFNIIESERNNWAARGGVPFSKIDLKY